MKNKTKKLDAVNLLLDSNRGIYIPKDFATLYETSGCYDGVSQEDIDALKNPDSETYWDSWECVLNNVTIKVDSGQTFTLYQDGDLWALCFEDMTTEEKENFGFED